MASKGSVPIDISAMIVLRVIGAVVVIGIIVALFTGVGDFKMCAGPFKQFYASIADMTGADLCG